jgi:hypothetical protein
MTPDELSRRLRLLANGIDSSDHPSISFVAAEMKRLLFQAEDAALPARNFAVGARRLSPSRSSGVDVTNEVAFKTAISRVSECVSPNVHNYRVP